MRPIAPVFTIAATAAVALILWQVGVRPLSGVMDVSPAARIAVVAPADETGLALIAGARMAADEVNQAGGLLGRQIELLIETEIPGTSSSLEMTRASLALAREFADDAGVVAVIGHGTSDSAIPAAQLYEMARKIYLAPFATNVGLASDYSNMVFAMLPDNQSATYALARYAAESGLRRVLVLADRSSYGRESSLYFLHWAQAFGIDVLHQGRIDRSLYSVRGTLVSLLDNPAFKGSDVDAIMMVGTAEEIGPMLREARAMGFEKPILSLDGMDDPVIAKVAGRALRNTYAINVSHMSGSEEASAQFFTEYERRTGERPTTVAGLGYDAVKLVEHAAAMVGTLDPQEMAGALHLIRHYDAPYQGVTGGFAFDTTGRAIKRHIYVIRHDGEAFRVVRTYELGKEVVGEGRPNTLIEPEADRADH